MSVIWNWVRNPKNLAVLSAFGTAVAFLISSAVKPERPQVPTATQPSIVVSPQIHIENNPTNIVTAQAQPQTPVALSIDRSSIDVPQSKLNGSSLGTPHFPVRRRLEPGFSVLVIPDFHVKVVSITGIENRLNVGLESELWGGERRDFAVGSLPKDVSIKGQTYQLSVESAVDGIAVILLDRTKQ